MRECMSLQSVSLYSDAKDLITDRLCLAGQSEKGIYSH